MTSQAKAKYRVPFQDIPGGGQAMMKFTYALDPEVRSASPVGTTRMSHMPDVWRVNEPFAARIRLVRHGRGRSSVRVSVRNTSNEDTYSMSLSAFYESVVRFGCVRGAIDGTWEYRKQGKDYTLWPSGQDVA